MRQVAVNLALGNLQISRQLTGRAECFRNPLHDLLPYGELVVRHDRRFRISQPSISDKVRITKRQLRQTLRHARMPAMQKTLISIVCAVFLVCVLSASTYAALKDTIRFPSEDGLMVTADLYIEKNDTNASFSTIKQAGVAGNTRKSHPDSIH